MSPVPSGSPARTLLLSPPSLSSHPNRLNDILHSLHDHKADLQMLDRLALGFVSLPHSTYDTIIVLADADGSYPRRSVLADRGVFKQVVQCLKPGGCLRSQDGTSGLQEDLRTEAVLAGLIVDNKEGFVKADLGEQQSVPLSLGKKRDRKAGTQNGEKTVRVLEASSPAIHENSRSKAGPVGIGFVDLTSDFGAEVNTGDAELPDGEIVNEDALLDGNDLGRPIIQPPECRPKSGKRRKACKDCTCGLAQKLDEEDTVKRTNADEMLDSMKLDRKDLAEVDFTVQGKVGSCGSCALGDAFRCDGCPYIGLPAFKPGEEVRLLNNDVQL